MRAGRPRSQGESPKGTLLNYWNNLSCRLEERILPQSLPRRAQPGARTAWSPSRVHHSPPRGGKVVDYDLLGARASRPHKALHSLAYFRDFDRPRTAPLLPFCLADAVPAGRVAACRIALKLSGRQSAKAAGCPQSRKPGRRGEASMGSQAQPGGEPRSRGLGAVGQGARGGGGIGRNRMRAGRPRSQGCLPAPQAGSVRRATSQKS